MSRIVLVLVVGLLVMSPGMALAQEPSHQSEETIRKIAWNPDSTQIAVGKITGVWIYTTDLELVTHLDIPFADGLAWSPDGRKLAVGVRVPDTFYPNWEVQIWDVASRTLEATGARERAEWVSLSWNPDGTRLAIANGHLYIWEVGTDQELVSLEGSAPVILAVAWSPDGNHLASIGSDRAVTIWEVDSQTIMQKLTDANLATPAVWNGDGTQIAAANDVEVTITIWDIVTGQPIMTLSGEGIFTNSIDWQMGTLVTAIPSSTPYGTSNLYVWNTVTGKLLRIIEEDMNIFTVALSSDGTHLAYGGIGGVVKLVDVPEDSQ